MTSTADTPTNEQGDLANALVQRLGSKTKGQLKLLAIILDAFEQPVQADRLATSDVVSEDFLVAFGDLLVLHHALFGDKLEKVAFEAALEKAMSSVGCSASRPISR